LQLVMTRLWSEDIAGGRVGGWRGGR
jgi:hypothetical protein